MKYLFVSLLSAAFFLLSFFPASAQLEADGRWNLGRGEPLSFDPDISAEDIAEVKSRWSKIDEADSASNEWTGTYGLYGSTHMTLLKWSPGSGYVTISVNTCMATIMRVSYGDAQMFGEQIVFYPKKAAGMSHDDAEMPQNPAPREWIPAKWRGVNYLLTEDEVKDFCDYVSGFKPGDEFEGNPFYEKGEPAGAADQPPILPKRFAHLVRKSVNGKIIAVGKRKIVKMEDGVSEPYYNSQTPVTINIGRADGVIEGMRIWVFNENNCTLSDDVELTEIREKTSVGFIRRYLEDAPLVPASRRKDLEGYTPIKNGWKVSINQHLYYEHCEAFEDKNEQQ